MAWLQKGAVSLTPLSQAETAIRQADYQIEQGYLELGRMIYQRDRQGCEELKKLGQEVSSYEGLVNKISQDMANRDSYYRNYLQLQGLMECKNCQVQIPFGSVYCPQCGCKADEINIAYQSSLITCKGCGAKLSKGTMFCTGCGMKAGSVGEG